jgi:hypothetical protein
VDDGATRSKSVTKLQAWPFLSRSLLAGAAAGGENKMKKNETKMKQNITK